MAVRVAVNVGGKLGVKVVGKIAEKAVGWAAVVRAEDGSVVGQVVVKVSVRVVEMAVVGWTVAGKVAAATCTSHSVTAFNQQRKRWLFGSPQDAPLALTN